MSLRNISTIKGPSAGREVDTFRDQDQQSYSADDKFNLVKSVYCVTQQTYKGSSTVHPEDGPLRVEICRSDIYI